MKDFRKLIKRHITASVLIGAVFCNSLVSLADTYNKDDYPQQVSRENYSYGSVTYNASLGYNDHKCGAYLGVNMSEPVRVHIYCNVYDIRLGACVGENEENRNIGSVTKIVNYDTKFILNCKGSFYISNMSSPVWTESLAN